MINIIILISVLCLFIGFLVGYTVFHNQIKEGVIYHNGKVYKIEEFTIELTLGGNGD